LADADQRYNFLCPNCSGSFSIQIERIPPVQARFRCPHCREPMDFPSRDEARELIGRQSGGVKVGASPARPAVESAVSRVPAPPPASSESDPSSAAAFRVEKAGFESDVFDRRGIRNLIRTGEVVEGDRVRVNDSEAVVAESLPYLKSLFNLAKGQKGKPPRCCRTHPDRIAFFRCHDSGRPLCEECSPDKKFGGSTIRVCLHCGGTADETPTA
jgi:predicted Zn finger-like uncharacterized protein